jgi:hypothetical protein
MSDTGLKNQKVTPAYAGGTINTDTDTSGGITIDTQGFEKVGYALHAGTVTAGTLLLKITETDNADGTTGAAEVGSYNVQETLSASNTVKKVETPVNKRYQRLRITSASSANIVVKGAIAVLSNARNAPV